VEESSIQQQMYPHATCFGCGPANPAGLHLASYAATDSAEGLVVAQFTPWSEHDNGIGYLNGGIIATVLDCHGGAAAIRHAYLQGWRQTPGAPYPYVTAGLDVRYLRPASLDQPSELRALVTDAQDDEVTVRAELWWDGKPRATGTSTWRRWRPRVV